MTTGRYAAGSFVINNLTYYFGGLSSSDDTPSTSGEVLNTTEVYDYNLDTHTVKQNIVHKTSFNIGQAGNGINLNMGGYNNGISC